MSRRGRFASHIEGVALRAGQDVGAERRLELSIVMPCLNESETLAICIRKAKKAIEENKIDGEVIVADNGSTDGSQNIAESLGARVVQVAKKGYGSALMGGILGASGRFILMGDSDDSYDFSGIMPFVQKLREGYDLVMGNRFRGGIQPGAMPFMHRYFGNPVLSGIGRVFFQTPVRDFHCGLRGFSKEAFLRMNLQTAGMEFASEIVVKASILGMKVCEVPTTLSPDGRSRPPHLRSWQDGWRHLRFLLIYSPRWLFLYPGLMLMLVGFLLALRLILGPVVVRGVSFDIHTMVYTGAIIVIGFDFVLFSVLARVLALKTKLLPSRPGLEKIFRVITLEKGLLAGCIVILCGIAGVVVSLLLWKDASFGALRPSVTLRLVVPSTILLILGSKIILASFLLSMMGLDTR